MAVIRPRRFRKTDMDRLSHKYGRDRQALMPILQEVQAQHSYISEAAMQLIGETLDMPPGEIYGVVSFYSFLNSEPKGQFVIRLCRTISCDMAGKDSVARQLENELGIHFNETTPDGLFTLEWANCMGMCDQGPAMMVNDQIFTKVTADKVNGIIEQFRSLRTAAPEQEVHS